MELALRAGVSSFFLLVTVASLGGGRWGAAPNRRQGRGERGVVRGTVSPPAAVAALLDSIGGATPHTPQGLGVVPLITPAVDLYAIGGLTIWFVNFYVTITLDFTRH